MADKMRYWFSCVAGIVPSSSRGSFGFHQTSLHEQFNTGPALPNSGSGYIDFLIVTTLTNSLTLTWCIHVLIRRMPNPQFYVSGDPWIIIGWYHSSISAWWPTITSTNAAMLSIGSFKIDFSYNWLNIQQFNSTTSIKHVICKMLLRPQCYKPRSLLHYASHHPVNRLFYHHNKPWNTHLSVNNDCLSHTNGAYHPAFAIIIVLTA